MRRLSLAIGILSVWTPNRHRRMWQVAPFGIQSSRATGSMLAFNVRHALEDLDPLGISLTDSVRFVP